MWIAARDEDGVIDTSTIQQIFAGELNSHEVSRKYITLTAQNWARFEQAIGSRTSAASQDFNIKNKVYGNDTTIVDNGFKWADKDFGDLTLGVVLSKSTTTYTTNYGPRRYFGLFGPRTKTETPNTTSVPGSEGEQLPDDGADYTRPVVFGRANVRGNIIYGTNPTQAAINSVYPALNHSAFIDRTTEATKYITVVYALAEGEVNDVSAIWSNLTEGSTVDTVALGHNAVASVRDADDNVIAIVEIKLGTYTQTANSALVSLAPEIDSTFRCLGTAYAVVTAIASDSFGEDYPNVTFQVGGKKYKHLAEV